MLSSQAYSRNTDFVPAAARHEARSEERVLSKLVLVLAHRSDELETFDVTARVPEVVFDAVVWVVHFKSHFHDDWLHNFFISG